LASKPLDGREPGAVGFSHVSLVLKTQAGSSHHAALAVHGEYGKCRPATRAAQKACQAGTTCARASAGTTHTASNSAPKVRYSNGLLTIVAENSTLGDILRAVRTQTGAAVEIPPNATERVVTHLGPGPARDVLVSLLHGSRFNYVMLGSPTHPGMVDRIILTSKSGGAADTGSAAIPPGQSPGAANPIEEPETPSGVDMAEQPADGGADLSPDQETEQPQPNGQQQVKTPEQLLRELQLQQQQQQQQQQGASGEGQPGPNPPPQ
jgi:hypothetical protein